MGYKVIIILLALCLYVCILRVLQGGSYKTKNKRVVEKTETPPCNIFIMNRNEVEETLRMALQKIKDLEHQNEILYAQVKVINIFERALYPQNNCCGGLAMGPNPEHYIHNLLDKIEQEKYLEKNPPEQEPERNEPPKYGPYTQSQLDKSLQNQFDGSLANLVIPKQTDVS